MQVLSELAGKAASLVQETYFSSCCIRSLHDGRWKRAVESDSI